VQTRLNGLFRALAVLLPLAATAGVISPTSYTYTGGTPAGDPCCSAYEDPIPSKLIDGDFGTTATGDGSWVGWQPSSDSGAANITFFFGSSMTITNVALDFLRQDDAATELPESVTIGGKNFPTANFATNDTKGFVDYAGSWTGSSLLVTLNHGTTDWIFVNEAQFTGANGSGVPEPASFTLAGIAFGGLIIARKRFQRRNAA
jgi:hypothetical protein